MKTLIEMPLRGRSKRLIEDWGGLSIAHGAIKLKDYL